MSEIEIYQANQPINDKTRNLVNKIKVVNDSRYVEIWINDELVYDSQETENFSSDCDDCDKARYSMNHGGP
jgi:hypothetical protein